MQHQKSLSKTTIMFPQHNLHKYTWTSRDTKPHNQIGYVMIDKRWNSNTADIRPFRGATVMLTIILWLRKLDTDCQ